jgi:hypothetical protein
LNINVLRYILLDAKRLIALEERAGFSMASKSE